MLFRSEPFHKRAGIGILVIPDKQKSGYGNLALVLMKAYAFDFLRLDQLYVHIPEDNIASIRLFLKNNFSQTGILKNWLWMNDEYKDVLVMQCFSPE